MEPELEARIAAAAARGTALLAAGVTLDEVLRGFREEDQLGAIASMLALRAIEPISLTAAKELVATACEGKRFPHLGLDQLRHLAHPPRSQHIRGWMPLHLQSAIIHGRAWKLFVPGGPSSVLFFDSATADPAQAGSISGPGVSFDRIRDEVMTATAEPGWCDEVRVVRDEPDLLLVHFPRVRESG